MCYGTLKHKGSESYLICNQMMSLQGVSNVGRYFAEIKYV